MIDLKDLREHPAKYVDGCRKKNMPVDIDRVLALDTQRRALLTEQEAAKAQQNALAKETGPQIGRLKAAIGKASGVEKSRLERELGEIMAKPAALKERVQALETQIQGVEPELNALLLTIPLPPDADVPVGKGSEDNVELSRWHPAASEGPCGQAFDTGKSFESQRGFNPLNHIQLVERLGLADFERGVKMAGSRSYVLTGDGMLLHNAVLRYAFDFMTLTQGFKAMSVPVLVKEECMVGTGFFPAGREQAYHIEESKRGGGYDQFLTGTGEVGLMGIHQGEIIDESALPLRYTTVSTCFRREAGAAGKDTAGLYRIHQFDKVEQVVICKADSAESRMWHKTMLGYVQTLLKGRGLPHRRLQCCTGDLGVKNADMIDVECWMPGRGEMASEGGRAAHPTGDFGETHSASRLYDYQCRRLNMRYKTGHGTVFCHSLNNTVAASPRILIPILEMWQNADGTVTVPPALRAYMGGKDRIG